MKTTLLHLPPATPRPAHGRRLAKPLLVLLFMCMACALRAQTTWTGATGADWATATNWTAGVPDAADHVTIPEAATPPVLSTAAVAKSVVVATGASLTIAGTGSLTLNGSNNNRAFINFGTVINGGRLIVGDSESAAVGNFGLLNVGAFTNLAGGSIQIDRSSSVALFNSATFDNAGSITIGSLGTAGDRGLENQGTFTNRTGGSIQIDRSSSVALFNPATFDNAGSITIGSLGTAGVRGLENQGTFTNRTGGSIQIDRASSLALFNPATFDNAGSITIGSLAPAGVRGLNNQGTFTNRAGGRIQIDRASSLALLNFAAFDNAGSITIGSLAPAGVQGLNNQGPFTNRAGGSIQIDRASSALLNFNTFDNLACATLKVFGPFFNNNSFANAGFLTVNTTQPHDNRGTFVNNGAIGYPQGSPIPNVTNNGLSAPPLTVCSTGTVSPALLLGGANGFTAGGTWYSDQALTTPAGTYDQASNAFSPAGLAAGTYPLYFSATDQAGSCAQTLAVQVTVNPLPAVNAGPDQSVTPGFGSNCTNLTATPSGGSGGYAFAWNPGDLSGQTVQVCPTATTTYTVTLTDGNGCKATDQVTVNVRDVRCGPGGQNVSMCYYGQTICVPQSYVARYQSIGATLGACGSGNTRIGYEAEAATLPLALSLKAYPNPVADAMSLEVLAPQAGPATFEVLDLTGRTRQSRTEQLSEGLNEIEFHLGALPTGTYLIRAIDALGQQGTTRVSKQ